MIRRSLAVGALVLALAGCTVQAAPTPTPSSDPSAIAADCRALVNALNDSVHEMAQLSAEQIAADPDGALEVLDRSIDAIQASADAATTPEVRKAAGDTVTIMSDYLQTLRSTAGNPSDEQKTVISAKALLVKDQLQTVSALCS